MKKTNIPEFFPFSGQTCFLEGSSNLNDYIHGGFSDESRDKEASDVLKKLIEKYGIPKCGRNRATFISKYSVIKFPLNDDGETNNDMEAYFISDNTAKGKKIVLKGFTCIIQEKIIELSYPVDFTTLPEWTKNIDSGQVGYDHKGHIKAYDFADNINDLKNKKNKHKF